VPEQGRLFDWHCAHLVQYIVELALHNTDTKTNQDTSQLDREQHMERRWTGRYQGSFLLQQERRKGTVHPTVTQAKAIDKKQIVDNGYRTNVSY
jgi:hypothetical protein